MALLENILDYCLIPFKSVSPYHTKMHFQQVIRNINNVTNPKANIQVMSSLILVSPTIRLSFPINPIYRVLINSLFSPWNLYHISIQYSVSVPIIEVAFGDTVRVEWTGILGSYASYHDQGMIRYKLKLSHSNFNTSSLSSSVCIYRSLAICFHIHMYLPI